MCHIRSTARASEYRKLCPLAYAIDGGSEALGQLGQDEPASGMALEPLVVFALISGSVAIALHHRNSEGAGAGVARGRWLAGWLAGWLASLLAGRRQRENAMVGGKVRTDR